MYETLFHLYKRKSRINNLHKSEKKKKIVIHKRIYLFNKLNKFDHLVLSERPIYNFEHKNTKFEQYLKNYKISKVKKLQKVRTKSENLIALLF